MKCALTGLRWTLGIVIPIEAIVFVTPMPSQTAVRGSWLLAGVFLFAIAIHLLHGMFNVGNLAVYTPASIAVAFSRGA